jgi:ABC-type bacteriocin/lantibiotic exporter with double-glycine peptidase domain
MAHIKISKEGIKVTSIGLFLCVFFVIGVGVAIGLISDYGFQDFIKLKNLSTLFWMTIIFTGPVYGFLYLLMKDQILTEAMNNIKTIENEVDILQSNIEEDFFNKLVKINFKYIEKYYLQTQIQANKSFTVAVGAALFAFAIILVGVYLMFIGQVSSGYVSTAAGLLSEFVSAVFFYLYNKTIIKMGEYHHKLVLTQNVSLALKISEEMQGDEKLKIQSQIVHELMKDINSHIALQPSK